MLRWRGITRELTEEVLDTFLTHITFNDIYDNGVILDREFSVESIDDLTYRLVIEYGDATLGKGISTNHDGGFYQRLTNTSIFSVLHSFSQSFGMDDNWQFEGNTSDYDVINLTVESETALTDESIERKLIGDVIIRLSEFFKFDITATEELQSVWYITPDSIRLDELRSSDQSLDLQEIEETEDFTTYQNLFFEYLEYLLSRQTKEKIKLEPSLDILITYDLTVPNSSDIHVCRRYLLDNYGIDLLERKEMVKTKTATFN
jgi:hypothetical protein